MSILLNLPKFFFRPRRISSSADQNQGLYNLTFFPFHSNSYSWHQRVFNIRKPQKLISWTMPKKEDLIKGLSGRYGTQYLKGNPAYKYILYLWNHGILLPSNQSIIYTASEALQLQIQWEVLVPEILNYFYNEKWQQRDKRCYARVKTGEVRNCQIFYYIFLILYSGLLLAISHPASVSTSSPVNHEIWDPKTLLPQNRKILHSTSF